MTRQQNRANVESHDELKLEKLFLFEEWQKTCSLWELEGNVPPNKHANRRKNCTQTSNKARNVKTHLILFGVVSLKTFVCLLFGTFPAPRARWREEWNRKRKKAGRNEALFLFIPLLAFYEPRSQQCSLNIRCLDKEFVYLRPDATLQVRSDNCDERWVTRRNFNCLLWLALD